MSSVSRTRGASWLRLRRTARAISLAVVLFAAAGLAVAYFRSAAGSGSAATATTAPLTLSPATVAAELYPGGTGTVALSIANPNLNAVRVGSLSLDTTQGTAGFSVDATHSGCAVSALTYTRQTNGGGGWTVPAKAGAVNGTLSITLANALSMSAAALNACQGATLSAYLTVGP